MKIHQILGAPPIILTNEEKEFIQRHADEIPLTGLYERDEVIARILVRKGVYDISKDSRFMVLKRES